jgi:putative SOS response-associated peptidase YedK
MSHRRKWRPSCAGIPSPASAILDLLQWGLLPHFTEDPVHARRPINARAETVAASGMFRSAFAQRRCIVPAEGVL